MFSWAKRAASPPRASSTNATVGGQRDAPAAADAMDVVDVAVCCEHAAVARFAKEKLEAHG